ncbi:MAG: hypothetical protein HGA19_04330 [Oscillochloris sp.]|nr:hypothetical protein [Oscillochloris sp.]
MVRKVTATFLVAGLILALGLVLSPVKHVSAQQNVTWTTGFQVQNLGTGTATVTIELINQDGTTAATISGESILSGASKTYFPVPQVSGGFNGSAIISSTQPVAAILNILGNSGATPFYSEAATGITEGSTEVKLPLILRNNAGYDTWFAVQNAGTGTASVTVEFTAGGVGTTYTTAAVSIAPGASHTFDQSTDTNLGTKFVGSAVVKSAQPLAVVVNQVGKSTLKNMFTYSGFASGSNSVALPLVQQSNAGTVTGISVQNAGTVSANVTITYSANQVSGGASLANDTVTLAAGESKVFLKDAATRYVGSAKVTTGSTTQKVVVVVNQSSSTTGSAYEGLDESVATTKVSLPLLLAKNAGTSTGVQCRNVGDSTAAITLTYAANQVSGSTFNPTAETKTGIASGASVTFLQSFSQHYVGSGVVTTSPASNVVCIVNELDSDSGAGDGFMTYNGINY